MSDPLAGTVLSTSPNSILDGLSLFWQSLIPGDSVSEAAVRAKGIDPATGQPLSSLYAATLNASGVNTADPNAMAKYIRDLQDNADSGFLQGAQSDFEKLGGVSVLPFSPVVGGDSAFVSTYFGGGSGSGANWPLILLLLAGVGLLIWAVK